jgi:hypothetical protein
MKSVRVLASKTALAMSVTLVAATGALALAPSSSASTSTVVFDSTNSVSATGSVGVGAGRYYSFQFSALQATTVTEIQVYIATPPTFTTNISAAITSSANGGTTAGTFTSQSVQTVAAPCTQDPDGGSCALVTLSGTASLSAGTTYWVRFTNTGGTGNVQIFTRPGTGTLAGLPLEHTFGTNDIYTDNSGGSYLDSTGQGYPWILMSSPGGGGGGGTSDPEASSTPPPWLQSYGRKADGICRTGWHASWAEWAVDKSGGWVCNRTVFWNGSAWVENPNEVWGSANRADNAAWDGN